MPDTHPETQVGGIERIVWHPENTVVSTSSIFSLVEQVTDFGGARRAAEIYLANMDLATAKQWRGFFLGLNGMAGTFYLSDTKPSRYPIGTASGVPVVATGNTALSYTLLSEGWTTSVPNILRRGDEFSISDRIYTVTADADSDSSGDCSLSVWPRLPATLPADGTALDLGDDCRGIFRLEEIPGWASELGEYQGKLSFNVIEALNP